MLMTPLDDTVMASLIVAISTVIVQVIIANKQQKINDVRQEYTNKEFAERFERLEKKQDKHNSVIERMYAVERDLKTAYVRIDELKEDIRELKD